jgi:hypothetical protein
MFEKILVTVCGLLALPALADPTIVGNWELSHVAPQAIGNTMPRGVANTKISFAADGKLLTLAPDETSMQKAGHAEYSFDGKQLIIKESSGPGRPARVSFPDDSTMVVLPQYESQRTFKRIPVFTAKLEPKSLQLIVTKTDHGSEVPYDNADYSKLPLAERVKGSWEVTAYENVPSRHMPPYGFTNDVWTIDGAGVTIASRMLEREEAVPFSFRGGQLESSSLALGERGSRIAWKVSFDEWGRLVLDSEYCRVILKLMSKQKLDPSHVPVKIVLLKTV